MAGRIRAHDWAATPLGPVDSWPQSLRMGVDLMLGASTPVGIYWGPEFVLLYNDAWRALVGQKHPRALGRPAREVFPELWDTLGPMFASVLAGHGAEESEQRLPIDREGHLEEAWFHYSLNPIPREDGTVGGIFNIAIETTWRRRTEAELREREERYRTVFDSIDEGFCIIEVLFDAGGRPRDYRFLEANPAFERQTGLGNAVGRTMRELAPEHEEHWFETYGRIALTGVPERFEQPAQALGGRHFDVYAFRMGEPHERKVALLFNDVARRKQAERELRERAEFEQQLIGIVSHDLRQPLQAIGMSAAALLRRHDVSEGVRGAAVRILSGSDRMGRMLRDLLDFTQTRLGSGIPLERAPVDLGALAEHVADEARLVHPERPMDVAVRGDTWGTWDGDRLTQVLSNLVGNALAYSPEDTPVRLEVRGEGPDVLVQVHNAGAPIPQELLPRLFEPMKRGLPLARNPRRSIGLGLYIVKHVVDAHGGHMEVHSAEGEGTTFTVRLPRA